ncbi:MAG: hypothetical protein JXA36_00325 [Coriobacteriia bacterium]|nr:hypothetical protein [Coriobacteriia bacterium]
MAEPKLNRRERFVLGFYGLGAMFLGIAMVASSPLNVAGRRLPPNPIASTVAFIVAVVTIIASIVLATRFFGSKQGWKLIAREAWAGLLAGVVAGFLVGFALGAILIGYTLLVGLVAVYGGLAYVVFAFANRAEVP